MRTNPYIDKTKRHREIVRLDVHTNINEILRKIRRKGDSNRCEEHLRRTMRKRETEREREREKYEHLRSLKRKYDPIIRKQAIEDC